MIVEEGGERRGQDQAADGWEEGKGERKAKQTGLANPG